MIIDFDDETLYVDRIQEIVEAMDDPKIRYIFLKGWAGAGKSYAVMQLIIQEILDWLRVWFFRKVSRTLKASCLQLAKDVIKDFGVWDYITCKENKDIIADKGFAMMFGLDDAEKIKSIAQFDVFVVEEMTEITYEEFTQLDLRLRGGSNHKIIWIFNPVSARHRLKKEIYDKKKLRKNAIWIEKTARDNKFVWQDYLDSLDALKYKNKAKWKIYAMNEWWEWNKGSIFPSYEIFEHDIKPHVIGLDFGFNDPNAMTYLRIEDIAYSTITPNDNETVEVDQKTTQATPKPRKRLYIQEIIFSTGQTSQDLIREMEAKDVPKDTLIIADSARPEMIADIKKAGYRIKWVKKYKNSKNEQIDNIKQYDIYINGAHLVEEVAEYSRMLDKKTQVSLDVPEDWNDHCIDSALYGATKFKRWTVTALFM